MKILIAEDDTTSRLLLGASLKQLGHEVTATSNGREAWDALQREYFPILISDWMMPDMDGLELCRHVRAAPPEPYVYIILLTMMGGKTSYLEGMEAGTDDFITKPFDQEQLAARLRSAARVLDLHGTLRGANEALEHRVRERTAELTQANAQLEASRELAEAGSRAKSEFLSRMSHELRTPMNAILGFSQILRMEKQSAEQSEYLNYIAEAGHRLLALINGMLDITRLESSAPSLELEAVDIAALLQEALDAARPLAVRRHVELCVSPSQATDGAVVLGDPQRLRQVFDQLLSNAIKFNHEGGQVTLGYVEVEGNRGRIEVRDTGPGIAPHHMEKLFTAFERLGAEKRGIDGAGIGLALSKWLIEAMGGHITVRSTLGEGSTFCVELPLAQAQ
ncbi:MAG: response regulator [Armatimonadetes bacterium]|nr:response regulator [Armatimonadota bacterium]